MPVIFFSYNRFHWTIKRQLKSRQCRFPQLLGILLDISIFREMDRIRKSIKASLKFSTGKLPEFLQKINKEYTPFAAELISEQFYCSKANYSFIDVVLTLYYSTPE